MKVLHVLEKICPSRFLVLVVKIQAAGGFLVRIK
jgi:hypothetical protein